MVEVEKVEKVGRVDKVEKVVGRVEGVEKVEEDPKVSVVGETLVVMHLLQGHMGGIHIAVGGKGAERVAKIHKKQSPGTGEDTKKLVAGQETRTNQLSLMSQHQLMHQAQEALLLPFRCHLMQSLQKMSLLLTFQETM